MWELCTHHCPAEVKRLQRCTAAAMAACPDKALFIGHCFIYWGRNRHGGNASGQNCQRPAEGLVMEVGECCLEGNDEFQRWWGDNLVLLLKKLLVGTFFTAAL